MLHDHPLALDQPGPDITVTQADVDDYDNDTVDDDSNAQVTLGEQLTEEQVLGGLLVHSADNYADLLARWDAGSIPAFVDKMNADAVALGMTHSHFVDASGVDPGSESTASDLLKVAAPDMTDATFASMVKQSSITLPVAGTISTYTPFLGLDGVIGVKSGFTTQAGGCDVVAVMRTVHGTAGAAAGGRHGADGPRSAGPGGAARVGPRQRARPPDRQHAVLAGDRVAAHVAAGGGSVDGLTASSVSLLTWPGVTATRTFHPARHVSDQARRGTQVGTVVVTLGRQRVTVPVRLGTGPAAGVASPAPVLTA